MASITRLRRSVPFGEENSPQEKRKPVSGEKSDGFDCNICLDTVQDPVVTLCGHLYCWPCIYQWLQNNGEKQETCTCPVCKAPVSEENLVPLYTNGEPRKPSNPIASNLGSHIPSRPLAPSVEIKTPIRSVIDPQFHSRNIYPPAASSALIRRRRSENAFSPTVGEIGELIYHRMFGSSMITDFDAYPNSYHLESSTSPRIRRQILQADKSLSRICFFFFCFLVFCLLFF